jgi:hypothetical protein
MEGAIAKRGLKPNRCPNLWQKWRSIKIYLLSKNSSIVRSISLAICRNNLGEISLPL